MEACSELERTFCLLGFQVLNTMYSTIGKGVWHDHNDCSHE